MRKFTPCFYILLFFISCAHGQSPVTTPLTGNPADDTTVGAQSSCPQLWGLWDIEYNFEAGELDIAPLRTAAGTWNVTMFLQPPAGSSTGLGVQILDASNLFSEGRIDVRVTLNHPFPGPKLRGFDVRGLVMGNGAVNSPYNPDIIYPGQNNLRLLNADGYTRWMNATEFGLEGILGYTPGALGSSGFTPTATINGYKYFAELIETDQSVYEYFSSTLAYVTNRGSMTPGSSLARDYYLRFPTSPLQVKFQYGIIAGWEKATSGGDTPSPLDFPDNANAFEPVGLDIEDSSTLYYEGPDKKGGDISLRLNIVDWWAHWDPENLSDHISKIIISSDQTDLTGAPVNCVEFNFADLTQYATSAGNAEAVDIFIPDAKPSGVSGQEILIAIEMNGYDYTNPFGVPNDADTDPLTSYFLHSFEIATEYNDPPVIVSGIDGDADVFITDTEPYSVTATDEDSPTLGYEWTLRDTLTGDVLYGPSAGDTDGIWNIDWADADTPGIIEVHCVVSDEENQTLADPLAVAVDDVIFHADLADTVTGDNAGWTTNESQGISKWGSFTGQDEKLQGYGYKFGIFNTIYLNDSADILVTPMILIPAGIDRAIAVVFHSYDWEYYAPLEVGFDGSNFKVTQIPGLPTYTDPAMEIIGGKDYDGWLFDTAISGQEVFYSDQFTDEIQVSAFEIPPAYIGSDIYLGFAAATDSENYTENHGWLIDDVQVRALPVDGDAPPIAGGPVTGDDLLPLLPEYPGTYTAIGYDLEDELLSYAWTVRDPDSGDILWGPVTGDDSGEMIIDWTEVGLPGEYEVHVSIYDGCNPGVPVPPLTVTIQMPIFHADFSDVSTGDNSGWTAASQSGATIWTTDVGADGFLNGYGYKWGEFDTAYVENSQGILLSPEIAIPPGIPRASIYIRHDFEFLATLDGGNFKVTKVPQTPDFATTPEVIDGGFNYDAKLNGTVMDNQDAFGIGQTNINGLVSRMDLSSSYYGYSLRIGMATASGTTGFGMRGWLIDDVVIAITVE